MTSDEEAHVCLPTSGTDEYGRWDSKHQNGYRAPEVVQGMECLNPTLPHERLRLTNPRTKMTKEDGSE